MSTSSRLIYTAGTFKLTDEMRQARRLIIRSDVLRRPPSALYQNQRSNPPKNFYGYCSLWIGDYVVRVFPLEYDSQILLLWDNLEAQVYKGGICNTALLTDNIVALGAAMSPPAVLVPTTPEPPSFPGCPFLWLKFKLENLTRIQVTADWEPILGCPDILLPISLPILGDDVPEYPNDRPLSEDPARSLPEAGEKPGDTAPASAGDPDESLFTPITIRVTYDIGANGSIPSGGTVVVDFVVPNSSYTVELQDGIPPTACAGVAGIANPSPQPQRSVGVSPTGDSITLFTHNTCNLLSIISQEVV